MISDDEPAWRLVRIIFGVGAGVVVLFGFVLVASRLASLLSGLGPDDDPTTGYLLLNLVGSVLAATLAGMVGGWIGRSFIAPAILAVLILALGLAAGAQAAAGQPGWYPLAVTVLGAVGVLLGAWLAPRRVRAEA